MNSFFRSVPGRVVTDPLAASGADPQAHAVLGRGAEYGAAQYG